MLALIQTEPSLSALHMLPNFDLLVQLWNVARRPTFRATKVKAHAINIPVDPEPLTWEKLGNAAADLAANAFVKQLQTSVPVFSDEDVSTHVAEQKHYSLWLQYLHELQIARAQLFQHTPVATVTGTTQMPWTQQMDILRSWMPPAIQQFTVTSDDVAALDNSIWGSGYSLTILKWLEQVHWPQDEAMVDPLRAGITWYELTISFLWSSQWGIMINTGGQGQKFTPELVDINNPDAAWNLQVFSFERCVSHLQTLLNKSLFPQHREVTKSLKYLGATHGRKGFAQRPAFPYQRDIVDLLTRHFHQLKHGQALGGPLIPEVQRLVTPEVSPLDATDRRHGWHTRVQRYQATRRGEDTAV
eukprot:Skav208112  [mRNA]  locus=scaffold2016:25338:26411:- [translate_table: standard]